MAFKVGNKQRTIISDNLDVNINYIDSVNDVRLEGGKIILDLSKGNLFRLPSLDGNNIREYDGWNGGYYLQGTYDSDNTFNRNGISSVMPRYWLTNRHTNEITFENYPPAGEVRKVSLLANYNPMARNEWNANWSYGKGELLDFSGVITPGENAHFFDMSANGKHMINTKYLGASDPRKTLIYHRVLEKSYDLSDHDAASWGYRPFPAQSGDTGFYSYGFFPKLWDSADAAGADPANVTLFYNGDGSALYYINGQTDTFAKYPLSKPFSIATLDRTNRIDIDFTAWTSNTSPYLSWGRFHANGRYLFCMDYAMTGSGSNAFGVQRFTLSTPYDLETIIEGQWKQLGNHGGTIVQYPFDITPSGERLFRGVTDTKVVYHTFSEPFDLDTLGGSGAQYDYPGSGTLATSVSKVRNFQFVGPKKKWMLMSNEYTYYSSTLTRLYLLDDDTYPQIGGLDPSFSDGLMGDIWTFNDKILVDSSHMWGSPIKQQFGGRSGYSDSTASLGGKTYIHHIESDGYFKYHYERFKDGSGISQYPAPDHWDGNPKNKIRYVRPFATDYFEFLVMDSSKGAILTNHVSGRDNNYNPYPSSGEVLYNEPGVYTFVVPNGVSTITAYCTGGGQGGGSGTQSNRFGLLGNAYTGSGGQGGDGAWNTVTNFSVSGGQYYYVIVGAGGEIKTDTDSDVPFLIQNNGTNSYVTTSLFFGTVKARAKGGGDPNPSTNLGYISYGGRGGYPGTYAETADSGSPQTRSMGLGGGGGGAGGYAAYNSSDTYGRGGSGGIYAGEDGYGGTIYGLDGRGGGGGGAAPDYYKINLKSEFTPLRAGKGGNVAPYGPKYMDEHPTPNTRILVNGVGGSGAYADSNIFYDASWGGCGSRKRGAYTTEGAGAGGAGNSFRPFVAQGTYPYQSSRLFGGTAGSDGQVRLVWGNEHQSPYYRYRVNAVNSSLPGTESAFHAAADHRGSHIILFNPKQMDHWAG